MTDSSDKILSLLRSELEPFAFECHPFKIEWYNERVEDKYKLDYENDTLAVLILNTPSMFEKLFLPYLFQKFQNDRQSLEALNDPIDACLSRTFENVRKKFNNVDIINDYDMVPAIRRPKIIMQTCAHISGAAYFYNQAILSQDTNNNYPKMNLIGVCLHPVYGGWFAMRCVFIFRNVKFDNKPPQPADLLYGDNERIIDLLKQFNYNWRDWKYRDFIHAKEKYSDAQKVYFQTEPKHRKELINKWLDLASSPAHLSFHYKNLNSFTHLVDKNYLKKNFYL